MGDDICFLVTILYNNNSILRCAIKCLVDDLPSPHIAEYPAQYRECLEEFLPEHVKSCGPIIHAERIFEVHDSTSSK